MTSCNEYPCDKCSYKRFGEMIERREEDYSSTIAELMKKLVEVMEDAEREEQNSALL